MADPTVPTGQAWQNLLNYRTTVNPNIPASGGDPNFLQNLSNYQGGKDAWWSRRGIDETGTDVLSGVAFLDKPGQFEGAMTPEQMNRLYSTRPDVKEYFSRPDIIKHYGSEKAGVQWWMENFGQQLSPEKMEQITLGTTKPKDFKFEYEKALPEITARAEAIYGPQRARIEALAALSESKAKQAKIRSKEDFEDLMRREEESINRRGAFFSGGAIERGQRLRQQQAYTLGDLELQQLANQANFLADMGQLSASQAEYIQDRLTSAESGAYARWRDAMNDYRAEKQFAYQKGADEKRFEYQKYRDAKTDYYQEKDWLWKTYTDERDYQMNYYQWKKDYKLRKKASERSA